MRSKLYNHIVSVALGVLFVLSAFAPSSAVADRATINRIEKLRQEAMENYDLLDYETAKKLLTNALAIAKRKRLADDKVTAKVHINLAIVEFSGFGDSASAELQLIDAVNIDPDAGIPAAYKTSELQTLLDQVRKEAVSAVRPAVPEVVAPALQDTVDCGAVEGLEHRLIEEMPAGRSRTVDAYVASGVGAARVSLYYRPEGAVNFTRVKMRRKGSCKFVGTIPARAMRGSVLHYFVAAESNGDKTLASRGSKGSPNIIELLAGAGTAGQADDEDPLNSGGLRSVADSGAAPPDLFVTVAAGTGGGYVTGTTEQASNDVGCCFAPAAFHISPELGAYLSSRTALSLGVRLGLTVGANIDGHSTGAPAGFVRLRHNFRDGGTGVGVNLAVGFGVIRHTVSLKEGFMGDPEQDVDTQVSGPLFVGGGVGYFGKLGEALRVFAELNATAGLPVVDQLGSVENVSFAITGDLNAGVIFAF